MGGTYDLEFHPDLLVIRGSMVGGVDQPWHLAIRYREVTDIEMTGGVLKTGGGFIGGGFGAGAAIEGMIWASALNPLTSRVKAWTYLWIRSIGSELIFLAAGHTPEALRITLSPVYGSIGGPPPVGPDPVAEPGELMDHLELAQLAGEGLLSADEFASAKARSLG